jgi:hypothetical protein
MSMPPRSPVQPERREHERLAVDAPARLVEGGASLEGRIENVSPKGLAFATATMDPEFAVGARVVLVAPGAGDDGGEVRLDGRILRADEYSDGVANSRSYALAFDQPIDG